MRNEKETSSARTRRRAVKIHGSLPSLAAQLRVSTEDLAKWIEGRELPPHRVFLRALDLVFSRSSARRR
jgi:hypothetical protein